MFPRNLVPQSGIFVSCFPAISAIQDQYGLRILFGDPTGKMQLFEKAVRFQARGEGSST
jgi:hypothetical protein